MDKEAFQEELFNLIAYMITSARGLHDEPADYRTFRLLDSTGRLLEIMEAQDLLDPFLEEMKDAVDDERFGAMNEEGEIERLDAMVMKIAAELQRRLE
jgi:hypothetical protein